MRKGLVRAPAPRLQITLDSSTINKLFQYWLMVLPSVGKVNTIFRLWFFHILLIVTKRLSHESFSYWSLLNRVILCDTSSIDFGQSSQGWFTSNTEAFWPILLTSIKPYILRSSLMVDMEFVIPFTAPPIPISIYLVRLDVRSERGRGRGGVPLVCGCFVLCWGLHVLVQQSVTGFGWFILKFVEKEH